MRILWISDGIWSHTGFGIVGKNIVPRLKDKFEVGMINWQYQGAPFMVDGMKVYGTKTHFFGEDVFQKTVINFKPDVIITLGDHWMVNYVALPVHREFLKKLGIKWIWYLPVDTDMIPEQYINDIKSPDLVVCMAKFAKPIVEQYRENVDYIPHGVDTEIFKKLPKEEVAKWKVNNNIEDKFVIGMVARNQERKQINRLGKAFKIFAKDKNDVKLWLHTDPYDPMGAAKDYVGRKHPLLLYSLNKMKIMDKVLFSGITYNQGFTLETLNKIYNGFDIHALSTTGEGFGLPIVESMAAGVPNVMTDFTTARELVEDRGFVVPVEAYVEGNQGTNRALVNEKDMAGFFEYLYDDEKLRKEFSRKCIEFAKQYDWKNTIPDWVKVIEGLK